MPASLPMKALSTAYVAVPEPHYYAYEVYFGFEPGTNLGAFTRLSREIELRRWLAENDLTPLVVEGHRVVFEKDDDAVKMFEACS